MSFGIDRVERTSAHAAAAGPAHDDGHAEPAAIAALGGEVRDHVEGAAREVHELHLRHGPQAHVARAHGRADDRRFRDGRVDDALRAESVQEPFSHLERAAVGADVLAEEKHALVAAHFLASASRNAST